MDNSVGPKISAVVMIYNEERQIKDCLETIKWVDEIVICDSFSTDRTVEICRKYTDKIFQRKFDNFGNQKKWLLDKPSYQWVLFVEADERFSPELAVEIRQRLAIDEGYDGYWIPFKNFVFGQQMKGDFWNFKKIKLFKKEKGSWQDKFVHAGFILNGVAGCLSNYVFHYPYPNLKIMLTKQSRAVRLEARQLLNSNKRIGWGDAFRALYWVPLRFIKFFFLMKDYKSGFAGLIFCLVTSFYEIGIIYHYWKLKLWEKQV
ncbi:MAG: glycosyltransferase family 2 protein [Candidatus Omnitrophica bacterium]|nr:glycosyltransferase family 2 protein [Candidatus Omnitrophota bacterium]